MKKDYELLNAKIEKHIRGLITDGKLKAGDRLPPFRQIAREFKASVIPVVQATQKLADSGMVERIPGKGTFVRNIKSRPTITNRIGVLSWLSDESFFHASYYMAMASGVEMQAQAEKKTIIFRSLSLEKNLNPIKVIHELLPEVDGFIIVDILPEIFAKIEKTLHNLKKPVVVVHYEGVPDSIDSIVSDSRENTRKMIQFLIDQGHRRIACITKHQAFGQRISSPSFLKRIAAYRETLQENNLPVDESLVRYFDFDYNIMTHFSEHSFDSAPDYSPRVLQQIQDLLNLKNPPTAFFCLSDEIALHIYMMVRTLKLDIPRDLTVVGYDNIKEVRFVSPGLTTVNVPLIEMGVKGVQRLMELLTASREGFNNPCRTSLPGKVIVRESHRAI